MELKHGFRFTKQEELPEIDGVAFLAVHEESGAKLLLLENDDNNKSFAIGFKTPPKDNTGVFHILEHSVLCGSKRFPVKEPFVDLLKGSMQTFLNALTFSDKTMYPVASTNEQDLFNLMDVYLDAVFHPLIFEKRQIFEQEGWHYEFAEQEPSDEKSEPQTRQLTYNGVVFNEMKGALSDANTVLYNALQAGLFGDNCYAYESGGMPLEIPTLTYEGFLDEHRRHYRTDNCYIIMYGNFDEDRTLAFLDERYLTPVAIEQREAEEERKNARLACFEPLCPRSIDLHDWTRGQAHIPMKTAPENACAGTGYVIGDSHDRIRVLAADILLDALLGSNEAPLKRRLLDKGLAHDINAFVSDGILQPFAVIELQMPCETNKFGCSHSIVIEREVRALINEGLDHDLIEAALSHEEFTMREFNFGYADGVIHAMNALAGWLYNDDDATLYIRYEDAFAELRRKLDEGYFEELALELMCDNDHCFSAEIEPRPDMTDFVAELLEEENAQLSADDRTRIDAEVALLRELQEAPDTPEAIATLPRLAISDIDDAPEEPAYATDTDHALTCLYHTVPTHGIVYTYRCFGLEGVTFEELPYVSILANVLGKLDTAHHTAAELDTLVQGRLGNLSFFVDVYESPENIEIARPKLVVSASALSENIPFTAQLPREIMLETDFASEASRARILDILKQRKIGMEHAFAGSGHTCAMARCKSYSSKVGVVREQLGNVGFYQFLCELIEHYEERVDALVLNLESIAARVFCDDRNHMSFAGSPHDYSRFWDECPQLGRTSDASQALIIPEPVKRNEAFIVPSDVSFTARVWDRRLIKGCAPFTGAWSVASRALSFDYLWNEVRVKGGAYGVGFQAMYSGGLRFYSYRDPHVDETLERFARAAEYLSSFEPSREDLEGFIVASVAKIDAPIKPRDLVRRQMSDFWSERSRESRAKMRAEVIATEPADVRALAETVAAAIDAGATCTFGNREILENAKENLTIVPLIG